MERFRHPKILQVLHPVEECNETLAFAAEPVFASLANVLAYQEGGGGSSGSGGGGGVGPPATGASQQVPQTRPAHAREYNFLDIELKYGILQVRENKKKNFFFYFDLIFHVYCFQRYLDDAILNLVKLN